MRYSLLIAAALFVLGGVVPTTSQEEGTANELLNQCIPAEKQFDGKALKADEGVGAIYCLGYVTGFLDGATIEATTLYMATGTICLPEAGIAPDQAVRIAVKYLRENPQALHESRRSHLYIAIGRAFPCSESDQP